VKPPAIINITFGSTFENSTIKNPAIEDKDMKKNMIVNI